MGETTTNHAISDHNQDEGWVVCRVFKKKSLHHHHHKPSVDAGADNSSSATSRLDGGGALDQILQFMGTRSRKWERGASCSRNGGVDDRRPRETAGGGLLEMFMKLPALESPNINYNPYCSFAPVDGSCSMKAVEEEEAITGDWAAFDRLLASQLDGSTNGAGDAGCFGFEIDSSAGCRTVLVEENEEEYAYRPRGDGDLWSLTRTTSAISDNTSRASR